MNSPHALDELGVKITRGAFGSVSRSSYFIEAFAKSSSSLWSDVEAAAEYQFRIKFPGDEKHRTIRDYSRISVIDFIPPNGIERGDAELLVKARAAGTGDKPLVYRTTLRVYDGSSDIGLGEMPGELY